MLPKAPACRSFLVSTLLSCTIFCALALADSHLVDDQDDNPDIDWEGPWRRRPDMSAMDETLTLGNISGETMTFTFVGTSVKVYGAFKPDGTWDMYSLYTIDDRSSVEFRPPQYVPHHRYNQQFYDSGELPAGKHTLTIRNMGVHLWIDYFQVDDDGITSVLPAGTTSILSRTNIALPPSPPMIISASISRSGSEGGDPGVLTPLTPKSATSSHPPVQIPTTISTLFSPISPSLPLSLPTSSTVYPEPSISMSPGPHVVSHGTLITLTVVTVIGIVLLALLVQLGRWRLQQIRMRSRFRTPLSWKLPVARDPLRLSSPTPSAISRPSAWAAEVLHSFSNMLPRAVADTRRSVDGGVRVAGGPAVSDAHAPLISDTTSEKSTLPPSYKEYEPL